MRDEIKAAVKAYVLQEFLPGEAEAALTDQTRLIGDGILDSMACLRLVFFLEERFDAAIPARHVDSEHLDTLDRIVDTVIGTMSCA